MSRKLTSQPHRSNGWQRKSSPVLVGKDLLELLTTSMYVEPLTIYREYVQNAADSIEAGGRSESFSAQHRQHVNIMIDSSNRTVKICDTGPGINKQHFEESLIGLGTSAKRGTGARGFRGIGRLAGIGYCQELVFRSRDAAHEQVLEMRWDCKKIKSMLRSNAVNISLQELMNDTIELRTIEGTSSPSHFFEVELRGIVRHKNDSLLNANAVYDYLSEVAPVPFAPDFHLGQAIVATLREHVSLGDIDIQISGIERPVYRPYGAVIENDEKTYDRFSDLEIHPVPSVDGNVAAIAWFLHHGYKGAIPSDNIRGLRMRTGNIQVGGNQLLQELFSEPRFNLWAVGEIHTIDNRLLPNGRRDHYEQNVHFNNLMIQVLPFARQISSRCRRSSIVRNLARDCERCAILAAQKIEILKQRSLTDPARKQVEFEIEEFLLRLRRNVARELLSKQQQKSLKLTISKLKCNFTRARKGSELSPTLQKMGTVKRKVYEEVFALIYDCSTSQRAAHDLVERMLSKLSARSTQPNATKRMPNR